MNEQIEQLSAKLKEYEKYMMFPAGHFYSPVVNLDELKEREHEIWRKNAEGYFPGIDLNLSKQVSLLEDLSKLYPAIPIPENKSDEFRYYYNNQFFSYSDGVILYAFIQHFSPSGIIEVGSGFSSALILDAVRFLKRPNISLSFIEPFPERLNALISDEDRQHVAVFEKDVQQIPVSFFEQLEGNDILFIDSTHVAKTGSDLNYLLFEVLPALKKGVLIHFHDIFYPFEYPKSWVYDGRSWNEIYILRSFLMYNDSFEIVLFPNFIFRKHRECFVDMPVCSKYGGASLWLRKVK